MPRNKELEEAILSEFVEALIDVAPPAKPRRHEIACH